MLNDNINTDIEKVPGINCIISCIPAQKFNKNDLDMKLFLSANSIYFIVSRTLKKIYVGITGTPSSRINDHRGRKNSVCRGWPEHIIIVKSDEASNPIPAGVLHSLERKFFFKFTPENLCLYERINTGTPTEYQISRHEALIDGILEKILDTYIFQNIPNLYEVSSNAPGVIECIDCRNPILPLLKVEEDISFIFIPENIYHYKFCNIKIAKQLNGNNFLIKKGSFTDNISVSEHPMIANIAITKESLIKSGFISIRVYSEHRFFLCEKEILYFNENIMFPSIDYITQLIVGNSVGSIFTVVKR